MTDPNQPQPDGFPRQPIRRPAPRQPGRPADSPPTTGPLPMGPPPGSSPGGTPAPMPTPIPGQPTVPSFQPTPGAPGNQPKPAGPFQQPAGIVAAPDAGETYEKRGAKSPSLLPFAIAGGVCLLLLGIGLLAFLGTRGSDDEKKGSATASARSSGRTGRRNAVVQTPPRKRPFSRHVVEERDSKLDRVRTAIDEDEVLAQAAGVGGLPTGPDSGAASKSGGLVTGNDANVFDGELPDADDLNLDAMDTATDPEKPAVEDEEEGTGEEEPEERPDPFTDLPERVGLPKLAGSAAGADPITLGVVHLLESDDVSFALRHGDSALGPRGRFEMEPTDDSRKARATLKLSGGQALPVAQVGVENDELKFQWLADDATREADCLRNCSLLVTVDEQSRAITLREPEIIAPWKVDPLKGGATFERKLDSVPKSATLGVEILDLSDRFPAHTFVGSRRLQPSKGTRIRMQGPSKVDLFALDIRLRTTKTDAFSLMAKTVWPEGDKFNPKAIRSQAATIQVRKVALQNQLQSMPAGNRGLAKQQVTAMDAQIARYQELQDACDKMQGGGEIHFRVFMNFAGMESDLLTSKTGPAATADSPAVFSGIKEAAEQLDAEDPGEG